MFVAGIFYTALGVVVGVVAKLADSTVSAVIAGALVISGMIAMTGYEIVEAIKSKR